MNTFSKLSKWLLVIAALALMTSIFVPIWRIELDAPQYPEGMMLQIYSNKITGSLQTINGLNHYIGMKQIRPDDFVEFKVLPYIFAFFGLLTLLVAYLGRKKLLYTLLGLFVLFGVLAMYDFWLWEYDYGHNLSPNAAIIVPGMVYQPPLIGFKQLLNFGAYSVPDIGGWLMVFSGLIMIFVVLLENKIIKCKKAGIACVSTIVLLLSASCGQAEPQPIKLNVDNCDNCKMTITDIRFASELISSKGRIYKFDDISCLVAYKTTSKLSNSRYFVSDFSVPNKLINVEIAVFIKGDNIASPMRGNIAAFSQVDSAQNNRMRLQANATSWEQIEK